MTNLKKTIAVVLAFAMIFSMGIMSTFAYSDVEANTTVGEAVGILSNLNILNGFEDGTFKPDDTVTRAQMAAIICRTLGYESQAQSSAGTTIFDDVAADHWAAGYINVAQSLGIINGYGNGNFGPEDQVTYEQAVKMIVCALGYDLVAQSKGGYPTGYLSVASSEGITKAANGKVGDAAKRSTVAVLVYNSLEVRLLDQSSWTTDGSDEYSKSDDTILSKYLEVNKWEGVVTSVPFVDYVSNGYDVDNTPVINIDGFYKYYSDGKEVKYEDTTGDVDCSLVDAGSFFGKKVIAYIGDDEDEETGNKMVYAISEKSNGNKVTSISSTQLVDEDDKEFRTPGQISYRKVGATKVYDLDLADNAKYYVNYAAETAAGMLVANAKDNNGEDRDEVATEDIAAVLEDGGTIELISNNNDDKIEYVVINAYATEGTIETVTNDEGIYTFDKYNGDLDDIDTEADDELVVIYKDGELVDVTALAEGDTVSTVEVGNDVRILYASSKSVTGSVDSYDPTDETITIGGVDYELSPFMTKTVSSLKDEEGTFYLNVNGQIAHNESDSTASGNYGLVLAVDYESGITDGYVVQVAMFDGTVAEYDLASKAKFYNANGSYTGYEDDDKTAAKLASLATDANVTNVATTYKTQIKTAKDMVFKITIKNDEITKIKTLTGDSINYLGTNTKKYDAEAMSYGSAEFDEDTVVFAVEPAYSATSTTAIEDDDVSVGKVSAFFADEDDALTFIALDEDNGVCGAVLGFDLNASVSEDSDAVIITGTKTVTYDDDEATQITGIQAGKEVTYIIYDEDDDYTNNGDPTELAKGDVILVGVADADGVVNDFKLLYTADKTGALGTVDSVAAKGDDKDEIYNAVGNLDKAKTKDSSNKFFLDADVDNDYDTFAAAADGITMRASANYTLVDYTESTKNPDIAAKSASSALSTSSKYETVVFVRVYDGVLRDVVAYRFLAE